MDRQDPRIDNQKWFMDKWNEHVKAWTEFALNNYNRHVEFEYWGSSELLARLSQDKHIGTRRFWFNGASISDEWLSGKLQESIDSLGKRYTPELNFELEIANVFDGISRDSAFLESFFQMHHVMQRKIMEALRQVKAPILAETVANMRQRTTEFQSFIESMPQPFSEMYSIDFDQLDAKCTSLGILIMDGIVELEKLQQLELRSNEKQKYFDSRGQKYDAEIRALTQCHYQIREFQEFIQGVSVQTVNTSAMVIAGEAGIGKSHLLADVAMKRASAGKPVLLLLGQHFISDESPWTQILRNQLRVDATEDELLGVLNAKAILGMEA